MRGELFEFGQPQRHIGIDRGLFNHCRNGTFDARRVELAVLFLDAAKEIIDALFKVFARFFRNYLIERELFKDDVAQHRFFLLFYSLHDRPRFFLNNPVGQPGQHLARHDLSLAGKQNSAVRGEHILGQRRAHYDFDFFFFFLHPLKFYLTFQIMEQDSRVRGKDILETIRFSMLCFYPIPSSSNVYYSSFLLLFCFSRNSSFELRFCLFQLPVHTLNLVISKNFGSAFTRTPVSLISIDCFNVSARRALVKYPSRKHKGPNDSI